MNELGLRIKKLRKEKKLTLAELAGDRLTKGMLSLIENGKAQPSMESLHYIADQLGIDVSVLLNDGQVEQLRELLLEVEDAHKNLGNDKEQIEKVLQKIEPLRHQLNGKNYEEVRLLDLWALLHLSLGQDIGRQTMYEVIDGYEKIHAYSRIIKCYTALCREAFGQRNYRQALQYMQEAEKRIEPHIHLIDKLTILDMNYNLMVLYAAIGNTKNTQKHFDYALQIANEEKIYYRIDDFYRFIFTQAIDQDAHEECRYYLTKLEQHALFTENRAAQYNAVIFKMQYANLIDHAYERVPQLLAELDGALEEDFVREFIDSEITYALWAQGRFKEAIEQSKDYRIPSFLHHPIDLSILYKYFAVRALCYFEIGEIEAAKRDILYAMDGVKDLPSNIYNDFIREAYNKIQSSR